MLGMTLANSLAPLGHRLSVAAAHSGPARQAATRRHAVADLPKDKLESAGGPHVGGVSAALERRSCVRDDDASTFPTFIGPLARAYYFMGARLTGAERRRRAALFGGFADVRRPVAPYRWSLASEALIEIPVTTVPFLRLPFHLSYILYLASFSTAVALAYLRMALFLCRATSTPPSFLLHPLDFLGFDSGVGLEFFPAMRLEHRRKCDLARRAVALLCSEYEPAGLRRLAQAIAEGRKLASRVPSFPRRQGERPA